MAEMAVSFVVNQLGPVVTENVNLLISIHKGFADIKNELVYIRAFLKDADRRAAAQGDNTDEGVKTWVKQLREVAFRIEDVADEYMIYVGEPSRDPGCAALFCEYVKLIKHLIPSLRIVYAIQDINSCLSGIKERSGSYGFQIQSYVEQGPTGDKSIKWHELRMASLYIEEEEVVGFEDKRDELIGYLEDRPSERTIISVVGMGGLGKTSLAKIVFDKGKKTGHFEFCAWITVSQSYTVEALLRKILEQYCKERKEQPPPELSKMNREELTAEVRNKLKLARYFFVFDDVWNVKFLGEIDSAVYDNKNGSRILITTRSTDVVESCMKYSLVHVHELQFLPPEKSWELFCKKAFKFENECCPEELKVISSEIVGKCKGLPLAIAAIGGLLCTKEKKSFEWQKLTRNLISEADVVTEILALSYDDLPYYLKACFLYFGIFPEDYDVGAKTLIRQWAAEGFVNCEKGKTLEEVAEQYLIELIHRNLVQVSSFSIDGRAKRCRVHDLLREVILKKIDDFSFCHFVSEDDQSFSSGIIRRLAVSTYSNELMRSIEGSRVRSMHIFEGVHLAEDFARSIPTKYRLLKVLDFEKSPLRYVPENLGNLFHLRYLSFRKIYMTSLPESIEKLQNLETLYIKGTEVAEVPKGINNLIKLRHLDCSKRWSDVGVKMDGGIGGLVSLQTLRTVKTNHVILGELGKLRQLRVLGLTEVKREHDSALCSSINEMQHLEELYIASAGFSNEVLDLHSISPPPLLRKLKLASKLEKLPSWVPELQNLVKLSLEFSKLTDDPLESLKNMPNLLFLSLLRAYAGESLHFQNGGFQKLKQLSVTGMDDLNSILIERGALTSLEKFKLATLPLLKDVPYGIHHLAKLEDFHVFDLADEFLSSIDPDKGGQNYWIVKHVPIVRIDSFGGEYWGTKVIRHSR